MGNAFAGRSKRKMMRGITALRRILRMGEDNPSRGDGSCIDTFFRRMKTYKYPIWRNSCVTVVGTPAQGKRNLYDNPNTSPTRMGFEKTIANCSGPSSCFTIYLICLILSDLPGASRIKGINTRENLQYRY